MSCDKCNYLIDISDLSTPYVIRTCSKCGRKINLRERSENGHGIKVEKGDKFTIPKGFINLSANPLKSNAVLTKYGLAWFSKLIFIGQLEKEPEKFFSRLKENDKYCNSILKESRLIEDFDIDNPDHSEDIFKILKENQNTLEWWALLFGMYNSIAEKAIEQNDPMKAAWAMASAERCRSMCVFKDNLEEVVWMGHSARRIINVIKKWHANKENSNEEFWQVVFNENPYVLSQLFSVPVIFIKDKAYVGGMNVDRQNAKFVDYLYTNESSNDAILVEIKTPMTKLVGTRYRRGVHKPSNDLSGSIVQVLDYRRELSKNIKEITNGTDHKIDVFNPRCVVIVGNASRELDTEKKRKSFELFRTSLKDVEVVTFDEIFKKAETLATLFNLKWENKKT
ncbi:DUF4263 domain-containing protein [Desulfobacula sp.]|uniref:Shedu immune nuclease family protein n=1 Tax=Desulfobacula sp. TaxID=2593537 RepID=UPI002614693D|nr:DUF4263 domain-containing protein [Desulfobacula sp.]